MVIVRGSFLELWSLRKGEDGAGHYMKSEGAPLNIHCHILSISTLKRSSLQQHSTDLLILGTDIGSLLIMEWTQKGFRSIATHPRPPLPPWGRTGCRPLSPGAYVACDPKGRAIFTAALQNLKMAYLVNEAADISCPSGGPILSSALQHTSDTLTVALCPIGTGYENPIFVTIEMDSNLQRTLCTWEVDLGLRSLVLRRTTKLSPLSSLLLPLPNTTTTTSDTSISTTILVGSPNLIETFDIFKGSTPISDVSFTGMPVKAMVLHSAKGDCLPLILSENGTIHLYPTMERWAKVSNGGGGGLNSCMAFFPSGYMCLGTAGGSGGDALNPRVWKVISLHGDNCISLIESSTEEAGKDSSLIYDSILGGTTATTKAKPQASTLVTLGPSTLSFYNPIHGFGSLGLSLIASSPIPKDPINLWTLACGGGNGSNVNNSTTTTSHIILTYPSKTLILSVGEDGVNEWEGRCVGTSGSEVTMCTGTSEEALFIEGPVVSIVDLSSDTITSSITLKQNPSAVSTSNLSQTVISFPDGSLSLLEVVNGVISVVSETKAAAPSSSATNTVTTALSIQPLSVGHLRERFCCQAVMVKKRFFIRSLSLLGEQEQQQERLGTLSMQEIGSRCDSILFMQDGSIHCALSNGVHLLLKISLTSGMLEGEEGSRMDVVSDRRIKLAQMLLGPTVVPLVLTPNDGKVEEGEGVIFPAFLSPPGGAPLLPLIIKDEADDEAANEEDDDDSENQNGEEGEQEEQEGQKERKERNSKKTKTDWQTSPLMLAAPFESGSGAGGGSKGGLVGISRNTLLIGVSEQLARGPTVKEALSIEEGSLKIISCLDGDGSFATLNSKTSTITLYGADGGRRTAFGSFDAGTHFSNGCLFEIERHLEREVLLAVHCLSSFSPIPPRSWKDSWIAVFRVCDGGCRLEFLHNTPIERGDDNACHSMAGFGGRLLTGLDNGIIRLFEVGKKRLLRRCEYRLGDLCGSVLSLNTEGWRVVVGTQHRSLHLLHYHDVDNRFQLLVDDCVPRRMGTVRPVFLDYNTVAAADRMGNFFVLTLQSPSLKKDPLLGKDGQPLLRTGDPLLISQLNESQQELFLLGRKGSSLNGAPLKWRSVVEWYLGSQTITSLHMMGANILYTTLEGSIGVFCAIQATSQIRELKEIESGLRSPSGRSLSSWRGYYQPERGVIDGDLIEAGQGGIFDSSSTSDLLTLLRSVRSKVNFK